MWRHLDKAPRISRFIFLRDRAGGYDGVRNGALVAFIADRTLYWPAHPAAHMGIYWRPESPDTAYRRMATAGPRTPAHDDEVLTAESCETAPSPLQRLSAREIQVLKLVVEGATSKEIARTIGLLPSTIDTYRSRIMTKLEAHDVPALVRLAIRHGLTSL